MRDASPLRARLLAGFFLLLAALPLAAAGRPSMVAHFQSTLSDEGYRKRTFNRVAKAWKSPAAAAYPKVDAKTVVQAVLSRDGRVMSTLVSTESGSKEWDAAARKGVEDAAPFEPLPASYRPATLEVHFHFSVVK